MSSSTSPTPTPTLTSSSAAPTRELVGSPPAPVVGRPRLVSRIDDGVRHSRLTLVLGPSGSGKSVLLQQWRESCSVEVAALALDREALDGVAVGTQLVGALAERHPSFGTGALDHLEYGGERLGRAFVGHLVEDLGELPPTVLVIDDAHGLPPGVAADLDRIIAQLPAGIRLVVAAREGPGLAVARLRAQSELTELRADELALTDDEARQVVQEVAGVALSGEQLARLQRRTEGWPVGVRLLALALRENPADAIDEHLTAFTGLPREVADYLAEEVVAAQRPELQEFLRASAVLDRFDVRACVVATGRAGAVALLGEVERRDLFLVPVDARRRWFRYHPLFADLLRHQLQTAEPGREAEILGQVAAHHLDHGELPEAITCLVRAERWHEAIDIIYVNGWALYERGGSSRTIAWLESMPGPALWAHPDGPRTLASAYRNVGSTARAEAVIDEIARRSADGDHDHRVLLLRMSGLPWGAPAAISLVASEAMVAWLDAQPPQLDLRPGELPHAWVRCLARLCRGRALIHLGRLDDAHAELEGVVAAADRYASWLVRALGVLARLDARLGDLAAAEGHARRALLTAETGPPTSPSALADAYLALAEVAFKRGALTTARELLAEAEPRSRVDRRSLLIAACAELAARLALADDQPDDGLRTLARWRREGLPAPPPDLAADLAATRARLLVRTGRSAAAKRVLAGAERTGSTIAAAAEVAAAEGDSATLSLVLDQWPGSPQVRSQIEYRRWRAVLARAEGDEEQAAEHRRAAATLAEQSGHRRLRLEVDRDAETTRRARRGEGPYRAIDPTGALPGDEVDDPSGPILDLDGRPLLSEREAEVVHLLGTLLSNQEIADQLGISSNTLKTHLRRTYRKLDVRTRRGAVERARELKGPAHRR